MRFVIEYKGKYELDESEVKEWYDDINFDKWDDLSVERKREEAVNSVKKSVSIQWI
jgi:hypothetical protein